MATLPRQWSAQLWNYSCFTLPLGRGAHSKALSHKVQLLASFESGPSAGGTWPPKHHPPPPHQVWGTGPKPERADWEVPDCTSALLRSPWGRAHSPAVSSPCFPITIEERMLPNASGCHGQAVSVRGLWTS